MKSIIIIGCLLGGMFALSGDVSPVTATYSLTMGTRPSLPAAPADTAPDIVQPSMSPSTVTEVTYAEVPVKVKEEEKPSFTLQTVNGITLYDDMDSVAKKLGKPGKITEDPHLKELVIYEYPEMSIVFSDGIVNFVELTEGAKTLLIDGVKMNASIDAVKKALGEPDYVTEDGLVFERGEALLKLFIDENSRKLTSIHYFHIYSM
ncbi:hypothetical protein [Paenibacillus paridis]|uniref:hypothetical protein n=1 Tax=Paenibacillus paridis TaxID=2583376 RepID=UPI00111E45A7|nr:hypothetical protein [Paenibacillus paridis]